jgi:hypothetical protein
VEQPLDAGRVVDALPLACQWLDSSAYFSAAEAVQRAQDLPPIETERPLRRQAVLARAAAAGANRGTH